MKKRILHKILKNLIWQGFHVLGYMLYILGVTEARVLGRNMGLKRKNKAIRSLSPFVSGYRENFDGIINSLDKNGECWLIEQVATLNFKTALDVGANIGNWTNCFAHHHPHANIHSFEIVPETFMILQRQTETLKQRVTCNCFGLSDTTGQLDIYIDLQSNVLSSVYDFSHGDCAARAILKCEVQIGDDYLERHSIDMVDFLKIDVEGAESAVLRGFTRSLWQKKIRLVQFEYNRGAIMSRFLLKDFYEFFYELGYCVGKLYPNGVRFADYKLEHEDFMGPNYVACHKDDYMLIEKISL